MIINRIRQRDYNCRYFKFDYISNNETLKKAMKKVQLYKLEIKWARFIDNSKGFGNKNEIEYS